MGVKVVVDMLHSTEYAAQSLPSVPARSRLTSLRGCSHVHTCQELIRLAFAVLVHFVPDATRRAWDGPDAGVPLRSSVSPQSFRVFYERVAHGPGGKSE